MLESATNANGLRRAYTNQGEFLIRYPAHGHLLNGARFVWKNIVTRFGVSHVLISDNGLQFDSKMFRRYCTSWGIQIGILLLLIPKGTDKQKL